MMTDTTDTGRPGLPGDRSGIAHLLVLSGLVGVGAGMGLELYRLAMLDPVVGTRTVPEWVEPARFALLVGSLVVFTYGMAIDDLFTDLRPIIGTCLVVGQWGLPLGIILDGRSGAASSAFGFLALASTTLLVVGTLAFVGAYLRSLRASRRERPGPTDE